MSEVYTDYDMVLKSIEGFSRGLYFALGISCALLYFFRGNQRDNEEDKLLLYGLALFILGNVFLVFMDYLSWPIFNVLTFFAIGGIYNIASSIFMMYNYEKKLQKKRYSLTLINIILAIVVTIISIFFIDLFILIHQLFMIITYTIVFIILTNYIMGSELEVKVLLLIFLIGIGFLMVGQIFTLLEDNYEFARIVAYLILSLSAFCLAIPLFTNPKRITNVLKAWKGIVIINISLFVFTYIILISFMYIFLVFTAFIYVNVEIIFITIIIYRAKKSIQEALNQRSGIASPLKIKKPMVNASGIFTRPSNLTEEEVTISKEKKICLVCKSIVKGQAFICPGCETFYCHKCFTALSDLENACWACNGILDEKKPMNLEKAEENLEIEPPINKKY